MSQANSYYACAMRSRRDLDGLDWGRAVHAVALTIKSNLKFNLEGDGVKSSARAALLLSSHILSIVGTQ